MAQNFKKPQTLKDYIRQEEMPSPACLKSLSELFRYFCRRVGKVLDELPVGSSKKKYKYNVDEQKQEVSFVLL